VGACMCEVMGCQELNQVFRMEKRIVHWVGKISLLQPLLTNICYKLGNVGKCMFYKATNCPIEGPFFGGEWKDMLTDTETRRGS
jgi:hypothetical protein